LFPAVQIAGPFLTGWLVDHTGQLSVGLAISAAFLGLASLAATRQRPAAKPSDAATDVPI
jgi:hypothetical protein